MKALPVMAAAALGTSAAWALWPIPTPRPMDASGPAPVALADANPAALDPAAFHAPLWVAPPALPAPAPAAPPPAPLRLQLLAILHEAGQADRAVLYDTDADAVRIVGVGDTIKGKAIERIETSQVAVDGRTLSLRAEGAAP